ncbi:MAG: NAD(P)-binding domain-containing protein [Acidimicrobiales bacterium]
MEISIIGTGFIGSTLGRALSSAGHQVTFGSRQPDDDDIVREDGTVAPVGEAISRSDVIIRPPRRRR